MKGYAKSIKSFFFLFALISSLSVTQAGVPAPERIEPPMWWTGMHHQELQLMIYGAGIAQCDIVIGNTGIELLYLGKTDNPNYLFIRLDISKADPGSFPIYFLNNGVPVYQAEYTLLSRSRQLSDNFYVDASDAVYLVMPDRFANGDASNDDMPGMLEKADRTNPDGRHGGDIAGIINNLDYVAGLGFTALWINPLLENNQPVYSYHGYAITDFYRIDPRFGSNEDYRNLVERANAKGIKVIKDMVLNHCGHYHWWMQDLPSHDWIHHWDRFTRTTYRMTTLLDPHAAEADRNQMLMGWFDTNMPDLNHGNEYLATYLKQQAVWWIEYAGINGIRLDTQAYSDKGYIADWTKYILNEYPGFYIVGEAWIGIPAILAYFQGGRKQHDGYDSGMPSIFDFAFYDAIRDGLVEEDGWNTGLLRIYHTLAQDFLYPDPFNLMVFADNHDVTRIFTALNEDVRLLKMALTLVFTTRGIPQMYYGTELLMTGWEHKGHGGIREDFPGGWADDSINAFVSEGRSDEQNAIYNHIARLLSFRKINTALHTGKLRQFVPQGGTYVYFRYNHENRVMVVLNNNPDKTDIDPARFFEMTSGYASGRDVFSGAVHLLDKPFSVPGRSAMVLELNIKP